MVHFQSIPENNKHENNTNKDVHKCIYETYNYHFMAKKASKQQIKFQSTLHSGPSCSKLTTLLVNDTLKFLT